MKMRRTLALMVALAGLTGSTVAIAAAQDPKPKAKAGDDKKTGKDDKKAPDKVTGKVEVYQVKTGWRFRVINSSDKTIAGAVRSYEKKEDALKELEDLKAILGSVTPKEVKE